METDYSNRVVNVSDYKISLARQLEENNRKMKEHDQELLNLRKKHESRKLEVNSFICDWQII